MATSSISSSKNIWYIDFEGYHFDNKFIVKEIAIVKKDSLQCYNYFVMNPCNIPHAPNTQTIHFQYKRHNLRWEFGDFKFCDVIEDIISKVKSSDAVYGKGAAKVAFLKKWLPQIQEMTWINTPFKKLYNCISEVCEIRHGFNCARRKAHELQYIDCMYNIK